MPSFAPLSYRLLGRRTTTPSRRSQRWRPVLESLEARIVPVLLASEFQPLFIAASAAGTSGPSVAAQSAAIAEIIANQSAIVPVPRPAQSPGSSVPGPQPSVSPPTAPCPPAPHPEIGKVLICHHPELGNELHFPISVSPNAVPAHLRQGDFIIDGSPGHTLADCQKQPPPRGVGDIGDTAGTDNSITVAGSDAGSTPLVHVFDANTGTEKFNFLAFDGDFRGGVRVAVGDVDGDGVPDIIAAAGPGGGPQIRVFDGTTGALKRVFFAFDSRFTGGVFVAAGDVNADGNDDIIVAADAGGGPNVIVFSGLDNSQLANFFAFDSAFTGGVRIAATDVNGDGFVDIVAAAGAGGGPNVTVFSGVDGSVLQSFFAADASMTAGLFVAAADTDNDGFGDIITGTGAGVAPQVSVFAGENGAEVERITPFDAAFTGGVRVAAIERGDGLADVVAMAGPGGGPDARVFSGLTGDEVDQFFVGSPTLTSGLFAAGSQTPVAVSTARNLINGGRHDTDADCQQSMPPSPTPSTEEEIAKAKEKGKVLICHHPALGNGLHFVISVSVHAVPAHLAQGDFIIDGTPGHTLADCEKQPPPRGVEDLTGSSGAINGNGQSNGANSAATISGHTDNGNNKDNGVGSANSHAANGGG